jgi:hypothetical protein
MEPKGRFYFLATGLIVAGLLMAAGGRTYVAAMSPSSTPTLATSPTAAAPSPAWSGRELDPIIIEGGWSSVVRVWVQGQGGLPVTIRSEDGWSAVNFVGSKPEYGPDALEFAPVWPGRYVIVPEGLGVSYTLELAPGQVAQVRFEPSTVSRPLAALTSTPSPSPSLSPPSLPSLTPEPPPTPALPPTPGAPITLMPGPTLFEPPDGTAVSLKIRLDLAWTWHETLGPDDYFRVEIWNNYDDFSNPIDVAWVKAFTYRDDSSRNPQYGSEYRWRITVVRGLPAREKDWSTPENQVWEPSNQFVPISEESETWTLVIDRACPPGVRSC